MSHHPLLAENRVATPSLAEVYASAYEATIEPVRFATQLLDGAAIPPVRTRAWVDAPVGVRRAGLLVCGLPWVLEDPRRVGRPLDGGDLDAAGRLVDYVPSAWRRVNTLLAVTELDRRRWGPTGRRADWIEHGDPTWSPPTLPPDPALEAAFAAARSRASQEAA
ncbi:hypothetical protein BJF78_24810 [Pseudonocardia sp. CNS-139]|nr:hypothetical protein BJF78_24810 [Pseudonocardia sp. CNS-139]